MCLEGGPLDHSYHAAWEEIKNPIIECSKIQMDKTSQADVWRKINDITDHPKWREILKQNVVEGKGGLQWKFNMEELTANVKKNHRCDITKWSTTYGLYPGRAFSLFADHSHWIFLNTNTIPIYKFFPRLEGQFGSLDLNYINTDESKTSK